MNKKFIYYFIAVLFVGGIPSATFVIKSRLSPKQETAKQETITCNEERKLCPDDSTVRRVGPNCEFSACPVLKTTATSSLEVSISTSSKATSTATIEQPIAKTNTEKNSPPLTTKKSSGGIASIITSIINKVTAPFKKNETSTSNYVSPTISPSTYISSSSTNTSVYKPLPPDNFAGEKFVVKDGNILTSDNKLVYNIPDIVIQQVSSSNPGWTNTIINVVQIGAVAPVLLNAIPIKDLPGKYYLSQNSFGNIEECEFSNKIFILDTLTDSVTLMYEENNTTLSRDDPRACNSEIFLLNTEGANLILKYHTIGTNTLCDSAWSEPEKTFYLDVTKLRTEGMKKYIIPEDLSNSAEQEEEACRNSL